MRVIRFIYLFSQALPPGQDDQRGKGDVSFTKKNFFSRRQWQHWRPTRLSNPITAVFHPYWRPPPARHLSDRDWERTALPPKKGEGLVDIFLDFLSSLLLLLRPADDVWRCFPSSVGISNFTRSHTHTPFSRFLDRGNRKGAEIFS